MLFFFITNSVELATFALRNGVDRIFVDLEINGKMQRQGHLDTLISRHSIADLAALRPCVPHGKLLVRINPLNEQSAFEIEEVLAHGADIVMLPMFRTPGEVGEFVRLIDGRARTSLLVETIGAMNSLEECVAIPGVDEVHLGLNDLHLELKKSFMFEPLADGLVEKMANVLNRAGVPFGIGGVARVGEGLLPAELILAEHVRLGSTAAILSRTFHRQAVSVAQIEEQMAFDVEIAQLRKAYEQHRTSNPEELNALHLEACDRIREIATLIAARRAAESLKTRTYA